MSKNIRGLSERKGLTDSLFREISESGRLNSVDRDNHLTRLSEKYLVSRSSLLSAGSFYDFLKSDISGKKALICDGTACLTSGKSGKLRKALSSKFADDEIGTVSCLGYCHSNNIYMKGRDLLPVEEIDSTGLTDASGDQLQERFSVGTNSADPVLVTDISDIFGYYGVMRRYGSDKARLLKEIELSALRGRGGAGFPLHLKLRISAEKRSGQKFVVCNADEGDPGAFSDKWLLDKRPHSILFGMVITGLIIGADTGVIYIRREYPESLRSVNAAVEEFERHKQVLLEPLGKDFSFTFHLFEGAGAYICGEETSLLNSIEGLRPEVRTRPPFPATYGLFGKPTILCNVETFANIWHIMDKGGEAYAAQGTERSTGTKLVSLDGAFNRPGLYEVTMGTPLRYVLNDMGGGTRYPVKAFQIGGPLGGIVPYSQIGNLNLDYESFSSGGFLLGHAGVVSIPEAFPMVNFLLHLFEFISKESCGKCFPCRIGSRRGYELLRDASEGRARIDMELFNDLLETMQLGSLCALGGGISLPLKNALQYFSTELDEYFDR